VQQLITTKEFDIMNNPMDVFVETFNSMDIRTKDYALRPVIGTINGSIVGLVSSHVTQQERNTRTPSARGYATYARDDATNDTRPIDDANTEASSKAEEAEDEVLRPAGTTPRLPPLETARILASLRNSLAMDLNIPDHAWATINDIQSTLDYMCKPQSPIDARVKATAAALELTEEEVRKAAQDGFNEDARRMQRNRPLITDILAHDIEEQLGLVEFHELPAQIQVKMGNAFAKSCEAQTQIAVSDMVRFGRLQRAGDVKLLKAAMAEIAAWMDHACTTDPEFYQAYMAAA
jgi:hypothetical protein